MSRWLGITLGDPTGVGPEVTLKALAHFASDDDWRYLLIGNQKQLLELNREFGLSLKLSPGSAANPDDRFCIHDPGGELPSDLEQGSPEAGAAALRYLHEGARLCLSGQLSGIITAPLNKEAAIRALQPNLGLVPNEIASLAQTFSGQTEFLSALAKTDRTAMMLLGSDERNRWLRVALVTTHLPLRLVADAISREKILMTIQLASQACLDLELAQARVAVCGLNPHAGEGGYLGTEEGTIISPAIELARAGGLNITGPMSGDTVFYYALHDHFDAVVAMYHDQGLAPLKLIGFESGINWTLGLPFIRTSPDHGTAYDIAGQNKANPASMIAAIRLARQLAKKRTTCHGVDRLVDRATAA